MTLGSKNKSIRISPDFILALSLAYLYVPLMLFLVTWIKLWIAAVAIAVCFYGAYCVFRDLREDVAEEDIRIGVMPLAVIGIILIGTGVLCGWGGWLPQASDWSKHNALLMDLVNYSWPVYYDDAVSPSMLTYYIGQYLVPAAVGKVFRSFRAAEIVMYIWGEVGLFLIIANLLRILKADTAIKQICTALMLVFFSGGLLVSQQLLEVLTGNASNDMRWMTSVNGSLLQYRSNFVDLRWVMPQCLSIWLILTLWWDHKEQIRDYVPLMIPACLNGILSFAGIIPMAFICACMEFCEHRTGIKKAVAEIFSPQNILSAVCLGGILLAYYAGNIFSDKPEGVGFSLNPISLWLYITFVLGHFGIYCLLIWKKNWKNGIFIGAFVTLLILPFFFMGKNNDLVLCCSIPGLFIVMICVTDYLFRFPKTFASGILTAFIFVSALNPMKEAASVIRSYVPGQLNHNVSVESLADYSNLVDEEILASWKYNYYSYDMDDNIFIKYFAQSQP